MITGPNNARHVGAIGECSFFYFVFFFLILTKIHIHIGYYLQNT